MMIEAEMVLFWLFWLLMGAALVAVPWVIFALASLFAGFPKLRLQQLLGIVGVAAWVFAFIATDTGPEGPLVLLLTISAVIVLLSFAGMWSQEFRLLMLRRSDEFPDRYDKLAWVFVLTVMAPAGVWLFRSYRRARWPEPFGAARPHPLDDPDPDPGVKVSELQRIGA
jgi:hypothetical protein